MDSLNEVIVRAKAACYLGRRIKDGREQAGLPRPHMV